MGEDEVDPLDALTDELRVAAAGALALGSWFAPTLDDCCLEAERLVGIVADQRPPDELHLFRMRADTALRTWSRIIAVTGAKPPHAEPLRR
jgi:hypothetical protein